MALLQFDTRRASLSYRLRNALPDPLLPRPWRRGIRRIRHPPSGSPIVQRALSYLDCKLIRHIDLESDYGLHVGRVRHGGMLNSGTPLVLIPEDDLLA